MRKTILKNTFVWFSCIYSSLTIVSSIINMVILNQTTDSYFHLIDRAVVVLIPILIYFVIEPLKLNQWIKLLIHYIATLALTMFEVFIVGLITSDLSPFAYRDQFLNYTIVYILISIGFIISKIFKTRKLK